MRQQPSNTLKLPCVPRGKSNSPNIPANGGEASALFAHDGSVASYAWDFGDSNSGTGATPSNSYAAAGTYDVVLTVTDDEGATGNITQQVVVTAPNQAPTASFTSISS